MQTRPTFITMPPPSFRPLQDDPSPLLSPPLTFYTAPSTPLQDTPKDPNPPSTPGSPPPFPLLHIAMSPQSLPQSPGFSLLSSPSTFNAPAAPLPPQDPPATSSAPADIVQEPFPDAPELPVDMIFDDEGLSTLEKIYLYSRSKTCYHRIFIANVLPDWLEHVTPHEAVEYVLPLLSTLAIDEVDELVKETLTSRLVTIMWWFLTHCQVSPEESINQDDMNPPQFHGLESTPLISVQAFTPILGTLLLSPNSNVGTAARYAVVQILERIKRADRMENNASDPSSSSTSTTGDPDESFSIGLFGKDERSLLEREILYQVVIGMGRLDAEGELEEDDDMDDYKQSFDDALEYQQPEADPSVGLRPGAPQQRGDLVVQVAETLEEYPSTSPREEHITTSQVERTTPKSEGNINPYFPVHPSLYKSRSGSLHGSDTKQGGSPASIPSSDSTGSTPGSTTGSSASSLDELSPSSQGQAQPYSSRIATSPASDAVLSPPSLTSRTIDNSSSTNSSSSSSSTEIATISSPTIQDLGLSQSHLPTIIEPSSSSSTESPKNFWSASSDRDPTQFTHTLHLENTTLEQGSSQSVPSMSSIPGVIDVQVPPPAEQEGDSEGEHDHAAIGRLSSMSLMAAVAASGCLDDSTKDVFVKEVERVSSDPIYWVRREACFALGALAKVVPDEVVHLTLMPLLQTMATDPVFHVRHSTLYALPAILTRLSPKQKRELALDALVPMSMDDSADVRSGVIEALGEVIYTFHHHDGHEHGHHPRSPSSSSPSDDTPPDQLLRMFLGRSKDRRILDGHQNRTSIEQEFIRANPRREQNLMAFYADPQRPLICAFNFPAVALTVGRNRWADELRDTYLSLAQNLMLGVQRTLAASLGELAKVIGPENAQKDMLGVWRGTVRNEEGEVRMKAVEAFGDFFGALGKSGQKELLFDLLIVWEAGYLRGWREKEKVASTLGKIAEAALGEEMWVLITRLEVLSLQDPVNATREAAISVLPTLWLKFKKSTEAFGFLRKELHALAASETSRKRMTCIACLQALTLPSPAHNQQIPLNMDDPACPSIEPLVRDPIIGVRIGLARLLCLLFSTFSKTRTPIPNAVLQAAARLKMDPSSDVRSFVIGLDEKKAKAEDTEAILQSTRPPLRSNRTRSASVTFATFSRPPPFSIPSAIPAT